MLSRYEHPEAAAILDEAYKYRTWAHIETDYLRVLSEHVSEADRAAYAQALDVPAPTPEEVALVETTTKHDVAAFLASWVIKAPAEYAEFRRWVHYGLTSSDIVDTCLALTVRELTRLMVRQSRGLSRAMTGLIRQADTVPLMVGRTHGMPAEPISLGRRVWTHHLAIEVAIERIRRAANSVPGKLSGPLGDNRQTYQQVIERETLVDFGLIACPYPTQIVPRHYLADWVQQVAGLASVLECYAQNVRFWHRDGEVTEGFAEGQVGSSAMPRKRNPIAAERICGLSRQVRAQVSVAMENAAVLWQERDISHSSAERILLDVVGNLAATMLDDATNLTLGLQIHPDQIRENFASVTTWGGSDRLADQIRAGAERLQAHTKISRGDGD